mmetsp:Transcript_9951/g.15003  ORF Transcript_9951/g.15003 Transcript_9951/m.15003 type:complete len:696 (+) Transcript_9951:116-2203(+)
MVRDRGVYAYACMCVCMCITLTAVSCSSSAAHDNTQHMEFHDTLSGSGSRGSMQSKWVQYIAADDSSVVKVEWIFRSVRGLTQRLKTEHCEPVTWVVSLNNSSIGQSTCMWSMRRGLCSSGCVLPRPNIRNTYFYIDPLDLLFNISSFSHNTEAYNLWDHTLSTKEYTVVDTEISMTETKYLRSLSSGYSEDWKSAKPLRLFSSDGYSYDNFGTSLSMHSDVTAVGAVTRDRGGLVFVFYRQGKDFFQDPYPLAGYQEYSNDFFGWSLDVYDRSIAVGAYQTVVQGEDATSVGAVYVFLHMSSGWTVESFIRIARERDGKDKEDDNAPRYDNFGWSLSLYDNTLVVGAYGDDSMGTSAGAVYVYDRLEGRAFSWSLTQKLVADDGMAYASFGWSVSLYENVTAVGAYGDSSVDSYMGAVYVFHRTDNMFWTLASKLVPADGGVNDFFGWDVEVWGDVLVSGSHSWAYTGSMDEVPVGAVYTYTRDITSSISENGVWGAEYKLKPIDAATRYFGNSVSLADNTMVVGAFGDASNMEESGSAFVYTATSHSSTHENGDPITSVHWSKRIKLSTNSTEGYMDFGYSVAVYDGVALVGAVRADGAVADSGAVFAFVRSVDKSSLGNPVSETTYIALVSFLPVLFAIVCAVIGIAMIFLKPDKSSQITVVDESVYGKDDHSGHDISAHSVTSLIPHHSGS